MISKTYYRYIWLLDLLLKSKRPLCFDEIQRFWLANPVSEGELSLRTFHEHRKGIKEMFGVDIVCEKGGWNSVYYVKNPEVLKENELGKWLLDRYSVPQEFVTFKSMKDRILLEETACSNQDYLIIIEAMMHNREMSIDYQKFGGPHETFHVWPYALKVYNHRWYLLGHIVERGELRTIAFDRMHHMTLNDKYFEYPKNFDARKYFANVVGVYVDKKLPVTKIRIRAYGNQADYIDTLPIHKSQRYGSSVHGEYMDFTYRLCITPEFISQLLALGDKIEVLEPESLREEIKEALRRSFERYDTDNKLKTMVL